MTSFCGSFAQLLIINPVHQSSHFIQAHALLNLHIIHSSHLAGGSRSRRNSTVAPPHQSTVNFQNEPTGTIGAGGGAGGGSGFPIYSPLSGPPRNPHSSTATLAPGYTSDFTALQLLRVMSRLTQPNTRALSYFMLCREFGVRAVDGMVRGRILDLRWMDPVTNEEEAEPTRQPPASRISRAVHPDSVFNTGLRRTSVGIHGNASQSGTVIGNDIGTLEDIEPIGMDPPEEVFHEDEEVFGPKVLPATPILRYAMLSVVAEYEDTRSVSEYASLSDVDEY
jgi:hypothetical protein